MWSVYSVHLVPFALVAFRVMGLFLTIPLLNASVVPTRLKILFACALAAAIYPALLGSVGVASIAPESVTLFALAPMVLFELAIGASMGFLAGLPLHAANFAGFIMGHQMGLTLARTYDPTSDIDTDLLSQVLFVIGAGAFMAVGGLESLFLTVAGSFERVPAGGFRPDITPLGLAVGLMGSGLELAIRISAPVTGIIALVMVAMGVLNKTLPQLNAMTVGFMLKIVLGLSMMAVGLGAMSQALVDDVTTTLTGVLEWWQQEEQQIAADVDAARQASEAVAASSGSQAAQQAE